MSLKEQFAKAKLLYQNAQDSALDKRSSEYQELVGQAIHAFEQCHTLVNSLSLFSINEGLEDIATADLPYLGVDYYVGMAYELSSNRKESVPKTINFLTKFLVQLDNYKVLPKHESKMVRALQDSGTSGLSAGDAAARRADKIARYKLEKELKQKIELVKDHTDDEVVRMAQLGQLGLFALEALTLLDGLDLEVHMLKMQSERSNQPGPSEEKEDNRLSNESGHYILDAGRKVEAPLLTKEGKINRPFTIVSAADRQKIKNQVKGYGQYMPTMTVEEYLDEEMKRGGIIQGGGPESAMPESDSDEDDLDKNDRKTMEARDWDEFVENNPKGSGNTMNLG